MEKLENIKERLESAVMEQMNKGMDHIDCAEMGACIDMIKDVAKSMYYCALIEAMEDSGAEYGKDYDEHGPYKYYTNRRGASASRSRRPEKYRDMDINSGRMYYTEGADMEKDPHAAWMGKSANTRKEYMESRADGDTGATIKALEAYTKDLTDDFMELVNGATESEKYMLRTKLQLLTQKI